MDTTEKQESQKTIIAFVAGLLIGGLLVWVFGSAPADAPTNVTNTTDDEQTEVTENTSDEEDASNDEDEETVTSTPTQTGTMSTANQPAGTSVAINNMVYPTTEGWVVVRENDGGRILGAARYDTETGLMPTSVKLLRATEAGKMYEVVFFSENGDRIFDAKVDTALETGATVFTAQ